MNKKISTEFALAVIVILAGFLGMAIWSIGRESNEEHTSTQEVSVKNSLAVSKANEESSKSTNQGGVLPFEPSLVLDTSNWGGYFSQKRGFSVKFPSDWRVLYEADGTLSKDALRDSFFDEPVTVSSPDKKWTISLFQKGNVPTDALVGCTQSLVEIHGAVAQESVCATEGGTVPGRYNYEFLDNGLVVISDNRTHIIDNIINSIVISKPQEQAVVNKNNRVGINNYVNQEFHYAIDYSSRYRVDEMRKSCVNIVQPTTKNGNFIVISSVRDEDCPPANGTGMGIGTKITQQPEEKLHINGETFSVQKTKIEYVDIDSGEKAVSINGNVNIGRGLDISFSCNPELWDECRSVIQSFRRIQ